MTPKRTSTASSPTRESVRDSHRRGEALLGKRSEVKEAHDRYASIEVAYPLKRMETYDGLAILTTKMRQNLGLAPPSGSAWTKIGKECTEFCEWDAGKPVDCCGPDVASGRYDSKPTQAH